MRVNSRHHACIALRPVELAQVSARHKFARVYLIETPKRGRVLPLQHRQSGGQVRRKSRVAAAGMALAGLASGTFATHRAKTASADGTPVNPANGGLKNDNTLQAVGWLTPHGYYENQAMAEGIAQLQRTNWDIYPGHLGDAEVQVNPSPPDPSRAGDEQCTQLGPGVTCDIETVNFYPSNMTGQFATDYYWKVLGCHELGHTLGNGERPLAYDPSGDSCEEQYLVNATTFTFDNGDLAFFNNVAWP